MLASIVFGITCLNRFIFGLQLQLFFGLFVYFLYR